MKKQGWLVLLTAGLALVLVLCLYIQHKSVPEEDPVSFLSFRVFSDGTSGSSEEIRCWSQDDERCFVFLPSYADLGRTEVRLSEPRNFRLGGVQLTQGLNCGCFSPDTDYELTGDGFAPKTLQFVQSANVAAMYIDTFSQSMEQVLADKSHRERTTITLYTADGQLDYQGYNVIRGHGNSTWYFDKKSYNLYLNDPASLLKMDKAKKWVLISNASDNTNLRNKLIYDFADRVSPRPGWVPTNEYVDLFINGEYAGLYLLCEKAENVAYKFKEKHDEPITICLNNHVTKLDHPDTALKLDDTIYAEIAAPSISSSSGYARLDAYLHELQSALASENWTDYIDLDSFARKYLIEEIFANTDGGKASQYYYWDQAEGKLYAGPCWDYDLTLGDTTWVGWFSPSCLMMQNALWYKDLWTHEGFAEYVQELYSSEYLPLLEQLLEELPAITEKTQKAADADQIRWSPLYYENGEDPMSVGQFLSDRVAFLNSLWIDHAEYCRISFVDPGLPGLTIDHSLFVPAGSPGSMIPSPKDMGMGDEYIWYLEGSDEPFDHSLAVTEDLSLYIKGAPAAEEPVRPSANFIITMFILIVSIILFLLFILFLLYIERNRERPGRRNCHA